MKYRHTYTLVVLFDNDEIVHYVYGANSKAEATKRFMEDDKSVRRQLRAYAPPKVRKILEVKCDVEKW